VDRLLRGHYSPVIAPTDSFVNPGPALPYFGLSLVGGVSAGCYQPLLPAGPSRRYLCESFPGCLGPCHGGFAERTCLFLPPRHRPSPVHYRGRLPACTRRNDFMTDPFFETAAISLCSGPQVCLPPRSFLPLRLIAAGQPRLLRPSRTCVVASACIGYANHPPRQLVVWGLAPTRFTGSKIVFLMPDFPKVRLGSQGFGVCGSFALCAVALTSRTPRGRVPHNERRDAK